MTKSFAFNPNAEEFDVVPDPYAPHRVAVHDIPIGRVFADRSGTVVFFYESADETLKVFGFDLSEATKIGNAFIRSVRAAEAQRDRLSGRSLYRVVEADGDRRLVTHMDSKWWMRPSKIRRQDKCTACRQPVEPGATAYVAVKVDPVTDWLAWLNWRHVRLCVPCVDIPDMPEGVTSIFASRSPQDVRPQDTKS